MINPSNVDAATYEPKPKTYNNQNKFPKAWDDGPAPEPKKFNKEPLDDGQKPYNTNFEKMNDNQHVSFPILYSQPETLSIEISPGQATSWQSCQRSRPLRIWESE
jgi:hypothetical protein